jgi:hypothetical protein
MDVAGFRSLILDPKLALLFDYWQRLRGERQMPDWAEIRPEEFAAALPHSWVWQTDEQGEFKLRIIGEAVMQMMELNLRGKGPYDLYPPDQARALTERLARIMAEPCCNFAIGNVYSGGELVGTGQRLGLPYFDRRAGRRGVIGGAVMDKRVRGNVEDTTSIYSLTAKEHYLPLP